MSLKFLGEWALWQGLLAAAALAVAAWFLYRKETTAGRPVLRWLLPGLRALVIFLAVLMITGPMLRHRSVTGERGRVHVFVDASQSMRLTDETMEPGRKLLFAQRMGWLPKEALDPGLAEAADAVGRARRAGARAEQEPAKAAERVKEFVRELAEAEPRIARARVEPAKGAAEVSAARFRKELAGPAEELAARKGAEPAKILPRLAELVKAAAGWEKDLRDAFSAHAARVAVTSDKAVQTALGRFDSTPRWKRVEAALMAGPKGFLEQLAEKHHVELMALAGDKAEPIWSSQKEVPEGTDPFLHSLPGAPEARVTNLSDGLKKRVEGKSEERVAVVLFSDGQHNEGSAPIGTAKFMGNLGVPVYAVGVGGTGQPEDVAVLQVRGPESVFYKDRVKGEIVLKDDMAPGKAFTLKVECNGQVVWEKALATDRSHLRTVAYDFPVENLVEKPAASKEKEVQVLSRPLSMRVTVSPVEGEKEKANNEGELHVHAIMHKRKLLLLDGRARWEFRYLRNLFERDEQWEVNALLADKDAWPRGAAAGQFPSDRDGLFAYDLIVMGEVPRQFLKMEELGWVRDFVERRGGGLILLDGRRGHVAELAKTPIGDLFPVEWEKEATGFRPARLRPSDTGARLGYLSLAAAGEKEDEVWASLPPPHWVAPARPLPGTETLLEAVVGERKVPALAFRRFGAGKVLYSGFDETWRWRYEVADKYHLKYWNQVGRWIMEAPFAVRDSRVSLHAGKIAYAPGESAEVRVRLRDAQGKPLDQANAEAMLFREGQKAGTVKLAPDPNGGGLYLGQTGPLPPGRYEVRVKADGLPEGESKAKTEFVVRPKEAGELSSLGLNEELLRQMAAQTVGGGYFREEDAAQIIPLLGQISEERVIESNTILWQSYVWFLPLVFLLTVEWVLRKWSGLL